VSAAESMLELPGGGRVLFTERCHGNMSSVAGERAEHGAQARERLCASIGVEHLIRGHQEHGTAVRRVRARPDWGQDQGHRTSADGQATALTGIGAMVLTADCLPVALGSTGAVAMIHTGWRGLAAGVLEQGVLAMRELADAEPIVAIIGPGAGVCCYQVGPEVRDAFGGAHSHEGHIDLRALARDRLLTAGVAEVRDVAVCTICRPRYFSHRREGARAGRQAGVAWLS
jgi:polyphenol oxidase